MTRDMNEKLGKTGVAGDVQILAEIQCTRPV